MEKTSTEVEQLLRSISLEPVLVGIVMGSESDREVMDAAVRELDERHIKHEVSVISAHRDPEKLAHYAKTAQQRGLRVIIAGAGKAAALPGVIAAYTPPAGHRRAHQDQRPRRPRLAAQHRADAARRAGRLRGHQRRAQRRHPGGQDPRASRPPADDPPPRGRPAAPRGRVAVPRAPLRHAARRARRLRAGTYLSWQRFRRLVRKESGMATIEVYSKEWCPYCAKAKALLDAKDLDRTT